MEISVQHVEVFRDVAIYFENEDLQISCDLMNEAYKLRKKGPLIKAKMAQYNTTNKPSNDLRTSIKTACLKLSGNPSLLVRLLPIAIHLYPDDPDLTDISEENKYLFSLHRKVTRLESQIDLMRSKFNQIHEAISYSGVLKVRELDDPIGQLLPLEYVSKESEKTLIVFGGMATKPSLPPKEFFASFANREVNIIFVKDFHQCWYQKGLIGITNDVDSTVEHIKTVIPKSTKHLTCLGTSSGGFAAIRMGVGLNADRILSFSPQTIINDEVFQKHKSLDSRISDLMNDENNFNLDLKAFLENSPKTNIEVHFGKKNADDKIAAHRIRKFVTLKPYPSDMHNIAAYLKKKGLLREILASI